MACIPAYNEEKRIASVILKTKRFVDAIIVCDDGSKDNTGQIAKDLGAIVITHDKNRGYGAAIISLFNKALNLGADYIVTLDADEQHNPLDIPRIVEPLVKGEADIVIASRFVEGGSSDIPLWRRFGISVINSISINDRTIKDTQSGYRAYNCEVLRKLKLYETGMGISTEILIKAIEINARIKEVPTKIYYYKDSSTHNPVIHGISVLVSSIKYNSIRKPLFFYGLSGIFLLVIIIFEIMAIHSYPYYEMFNKNSALITIITLILGVVLLNSVIQLLKILIRIHEHKNNKY